MNYKLTDNSNIIVKIEEDGTQRSVPIDPANRDYREYLEWIALGNTPEPLE